MNSYSPNQLFSARNAPLWVVLAFIIGMTIYSQVVKYEANSNQSTRDLTKTFPTHAYEAAFEGRGNAGLSIIYLYSDGKGKVRIESTIPNSTSVNSVIVDFIKKKNYYLHEKERTYLTSDLNKQGLGEFDEEMFKSVEAEDLGTRTIHGMKCQGYSTILNGDKNSTIESWFNTANGCLIESKAPKNKSSATLTRLINRQPKPSLFEIPAGFKLSATAF